MAERPILFSAPMIRAILDGGKTQTRRLVNPTGRIVGMSWSPLHPERGLRVTVRTGPRSTHTGPIGDHLDACPYGQPGDRLWVRETWRVKDYHLRTIALAATNEVTGHHMSRGDDAWWSRWGHRSVGDRWQPSIYMPRWASRITLEVTSVRVERLHEISEADATAEGVSASPSRALADGPVGLTAREAFADLWESINGPGSWASNPWVWVVGFRRVTP